MSDFSKFYSSSNEKIHSALFRIHHHIYQGALERIKEGLMELHKVECNHVDLREQMRPYVTQFEDLRIELEQIGAKAASFRTKLIYENGCTGECHK